MTESSGRSSGSALGEQRDYQRGAGFRSIHMARSPVPGMNSKW